MFAAHTDAFVVIERNCPDVRIDPYSSQGNAAARLMCHGVFNADIIANSSLSLQ